MLTDILGDEDHLGDMDFKVAGTDRGVTALQMDIKIQGITKEIMAVALSQAREGRMHILHLMQEALPHARTELSQHAPRMMSFKINPEKIRDVIGKGGSVIRALTEETGTTIDIQDDGTVTIASVNADACNAARKRIEDITADVEVGRIYEGTVLRLLDFGAIVQILPGRDGLLHISQIAKERVNNVSDYVKEGQSRARQGARGRREGPRAAVDEGRCRGRAEGRFACCCAGRSTSDTGGLMIPARRSFVAALGAALLVVAERRPAAGTGTASRPSKAAELEGLAREVYVYAYPLVLMDVTREVMTAKTPANTFQHKRTFPDPSFTDVVSPNADTLYSTAWLDLSNGPVMLSVPDTKGRYYLMPMLDAWTNVFQSPGKRTIGTEKREFAIVGPKWKGEMPKNAEEIRAPTRHGLDHRHARRPTARRTLPRSTRSRTSTSSRRSPARARLPRRYRQRRSQDAAGRPGGEDGREDLLFAGGHAAPSNPPAKEDAAMVERMKKLGIVPGQPFDTSKLDADSAKGLARRARNRRWPPSWLPPTAPPATSATAGPSTGTSAATAPTTDCAPSSPRRDLGANAPEDAIYPRTRLDGGGHALNGASKYVLHFDKGKTPPAEAFWSLTMYNDKQLFVANPIDRYAIGDRDKLHANADGSVDIYVQHDSPGKDKESNWLPAPKDNFNVILRVYWPKQEMLERRWKPPAIQKVG